MTAANAIDARRQIQRDFTKTLERCPRLGEESSRQLLEANISDRLGTGLNLRRQATTRTYVIELVQVCARLPRGLELLTDELTYLDPLAPEIPELLRLCEEWQAAKTYADSTWSELKSALQSVVLTGGEVKRDERDILRQLVVTATGSRMVELPKHCSTLWHVFVHLAGANTLPNMPPPCMALLERVARETNDPLLAAKLRGWNRTWAERWQLTDLLDGLSWPDSQNSVHLGGESALFDMQPSRTRPIEPPTRARMAELPVPREIFFPLVDALEAIPCLFSDETRAVLVSLLPPGIAGMVRYSPQRRIHALNIVRACLDYDGGLIELIATIRDIEGKESIPVRRLTAAARALPLELRPDEG